ncbi:MAG: tetratricopeptide repeat protein [Candidatus Eremiobacteraeota bacterium]|nr:tetratricopeptide repeat protein [Candidatus Eremiobacteraeota bacterium]
MPFTPSECPHCNTSGAALEPEKEYANSFKTFTCCSTEKKHRIIYFENPTYRKLYKRVIDKMKAIWEIRFEWRYTDHSPFHSTRILKWGEDLMLPLEEAGNDYSLKAEEMLLFALGAYMHDAAMQRIDDKAKRDIERIRETNNFNDRLKKLDKLYDSIRERHAKRAPEVAEEILGEIVETDDSLVNLADTILEPLKFICLFHSGKDVTKIDPNHDYHINQRLIKGSRINMLAGILRFSDELDLSRDRVPNRFPLERFPLGALSSLHWIKHILVESAYIDNHRIKIKFSYPEISGDNRERKEDESFYKQIAYWVKSKLEIEWDFIHNKMDMIHEGSSNLITPRLPSPDLYLENLSSAPLLPQFKFFEDSDKKKKIQSALENEINNLFRNEHSIPPRPELIDNEEIERQILAISIEPIEIMKSMGISAYFAGETEFAEKILSAVIEKKRDDTDILEILAEINYFRKEYEKSINFWERITKIKPDYHEALNNMGVAYGGLGQHEKAIECYEKALKIKPDFHEALYNMGRAYWKLGKHEKAIECYEKALKIKPDYHEALYNMGNAYWKLGKHEKAIECYEKALKIKPDSHEALSNMGITYGKLGQYEKAIECFDKALKINPDAHSALHNTGNAYGKLGQYEKAIECFDKALKIKPDYHEATSNMGSAYNALGQHEKAIEFYKKSLKIKPDYHEALNNMGAAYGELGKQEKAIECFEKALKIKPNYYKAIDNIGVIYAKLKQFDRAIECHKNALELKPGYPNALYNMACTYSLKYENSLKETPDSPSKSDLGNTLEYLKKAIKTDKKCREIAKTNPYFNPIRNLPEFKNLTESPQHEDSENSSPKPSRVSRRKKKVARNDPCPCGSGEKYKKCCLLKERK